MKATLVNHTRDGVPIWSVVDNKRLVAMSYTVCGGHYTMRRYCRGCGSDVSLMHPRYAELRTRIDQAITQAQESSMDHTFALTLVHRAACKEAVATADAHLNNVGLPTYSQLVAALGKLIPLADEAVTDRQATLDELPEDVALVGLMADDLTTARELYALAAPVAV